MKDEEKYILLVEDNPDDQELVRVALERAGVQNKLVVLSDGKQALDYLFTPEGSLHAAAVKGLKLILLDLKLPKVSGLEILERIRSDENLSAIPVVVFTSSSQEEDTITSYHLGANSYIRKPVDYDQFKKAIKTVADYWLHLNFPK